MNRLVAPVLFFLFFSKVDAQTSTLAIADSLYTIGEFNKAIEYYKEIDGSEEQIARSYDALGNLTQSIKYYKLAVSEENIEALTIYNYGKLLLKSGRNREADSIFQGLVKTNPRNPEFHYLLGTARERLNDSTAVSNYYRALEIDDKHQNAIFKIAKHLAEKRSFQEAATYVTRGISSDPESIRFLNLKAVIHYFLEEYHEAIATYEKLLERNQSNEILHSRLASSYNQKNRFEDAIDQYALLINEYDDKNPEWHFGLANNYAAIREYDKAQHHHEIAIQLQDVPLDASYLALAYVFAKKKDYKMQFETLKKAVSENSNNQRAKYLLATAADNYFEDDTKVIPYYEAYLETFGDKGLFSEFARQRIKDIKTELHFKAEKQ